jgi:RNA polymerase sigma-70 factor (ECF subfamily)
MASAGDTPQTGPIDPRIETARAGASDSLGRLLETCRNYLLLVAQQEMHPDLHAKIGASDLVQDTFLEAQRDFGLFDGQTEAELLAWLRRILLNNLANVARQYRNTDKRRLDREVPLDGESGDGRLLNLADAGDSPSADASAREQAERIRRALDQLPEHYRQVIQWRNYDRLPFT